MTSDPRTEEISGALDALRRRIDAACEGAGRSPAAVTLVAVTKTFPAADVRRLAGLGVRDVGENRDQEAAGKAAECADLDLTWHFVGQLQTNKARSVAAYADVVHSIDRSRLVDALDAAAAAHERDLDCLVQVSLDPSIGRGGAQPHEVAALAARIEAAERLRLRGVMAVAPLGADAASAFATLADVAADLRAKHPDATWISAGMTGDLEPAIAHGATHVRVGAALLGERPPLR